VRFLLGPAGSGKTWRCLSEMRAALKASPEGLPLLVLAPKQATFQLERQLLSDPELPGYTRLQILSFERLAWFLLSELAPAPPALLSAEGRVMVLRALLQRKRDELRIFRASARLPGFARQLSEVFRELQHHQFGRERLDQLAQRPDLPAALRDKLHDVTLLWRAYRAWLEAHQLQDADTLLELATGALKSQVSGFKSEMRLGGLWLDGFAELTPQELDLLAALAPRCEGATLAFCLDAEPKEERSWLSVWSSVSGAFRGCYDRLAALPQVEIRVELLPRDAARTRFAATPTLSHLEAQWSHPTPFTHHASRSTEPATHHPQHASSIRLVSCSTPEAEATFAAREILRFVRDGDARFRDCAVIVRSLERYHDPLRRVFTRYAIPCFLDRRESVAHHPLAELTRYALRTVAFGWQHEDWFGALKTGLIPARERDLDELENEALAHGWHGATWHQPLKLDDEPALAERLERVRLAVLPPFAELAKGLTACAGQPNGRELAAALRRLWQELGVENQLQSWAAPGAASGSPPLASPLHTSVWEQMQSWLENVALAFATEPLPLREWLPILEAGLANLTVGVIPPALDQVLLGAIDRSRNPELKLVLLLGLNEGVFPAPPPAPRLLTEADREALAARGACLGPSRQLLLGRERYYAYIACTRATERLVVTYAQQDAEGNPLNASVFVAQLKRLFPDLKEESFVPPERLPPERWHELESAAELVAVVAKVQSSKCKVQSVEAVEGLSQLQPVVGRLRQLALLPRPNDLRLSPAAAEALYGRELRTSVSGLENFAACPFKFFAGHGLLADERRIFEADGRQTGRFQHEVLSRFHRDLQAEGKRWRDESPENARSRLARIGGEVAADYGDGLFGSSGQAKFLARTLVAQLQHFIEVVVRWARQNQFDPREVELAFGLEAAPLSPWRIELGDGRALLLRGKIDRVDLCPGDGPGEALAVVVDYKSSPVSLDPILLQHGLELQLLGYLGALRHLDDPQARFGVARLVPAGAFYVPLRARAASGASRSDILEDARGGHRRAYQHAGRFDRRFLSRLDTRGERRGDQFKFAFNQDGAPAQRGNDALESSTFRALLDQVEAHLRGHAEAILAGAAAAHPYRKGNERACQFCEFQSICRFDPWEDGFRVLTRPAAKVAGERIV
jgi:ATP-dependent helicase/nuclease subunit B